MLTVPKEHVIVRVISRMLLSCMHGGATPWEEWYLSAANYQGGLYSIVSLLRGVWCGRGCGVARCDVVWVRLWDGVKESWCGVDASKC